MFMGLLLTMDINMRARPHIAFFFNFSLQGPVRHDVRPEDEPTPGLGTGTAPLPLTEVGGSTGLHEAHHAVCGLNLVGEVGQASGLVSLGGMSAVPRLLQPF